MLSQTNNDLWTSISEARIQLNSYGLRFVSTLPDPVSTLPPLCYFLGKLISLNLSFSLSCLLFFFLHSAQGRYRRAQGERRGGQAIYSTGPSTIMTEHSLAVVLFLYPGCQLIDIALSSSSLSRFYNTTLPLSLQALDSLQVKMRQR